MAIDRLLSPRRHLLHLESDTDRASAGGPGNRRRLRACLHDLWLSPHAGAVFDLHAARRINYIGVTFRTRSIEEIREIFDGVRNDIWPAVESRKLQLPIDKVFAFDDIGKAFEHMEANKHLGKIVVTQ